jgi:hypothetical protein
MVTMMMDDRFHLCVLLFRQALLRQFPPLVLVRLARAFRVNRKQGGQLVHLVAPAGWARPVNR